MLRDRQADIQTDRQMVAKTEPRESSGGINKSSAVAEMSDRLATIDMDRKVEGCCATYGGTAAWVTVLN